MTIEELKKIEKEGNEVFVGNNYCSLFSLVGSILVLYPNKNPEEVLETIKTITQVPLSDTPLYDIALKNNLPPPILVTKTDTYVTTRDWLLKGQGEALIQYLNSKLSNTDFPIEISYIKRDKNTKTSLADKCMNGSVAMLPCTISDTEGSFLDNHHIALAYSQNNWNIIDVNSSVCTIEEELLFEMIASESIGIHYVSEDEIISIIETDPIIFIDSIK